MKRKAAQAADAAGPRRSTRSLTKQRTVEDCFNAMVKAKTNTTSAAKVTVEVVQRPGMDQYAKDIIVDNYVRRRATSKENDEDEALEFIQLLRSFTTASAPPRQLDRASYRRLHQLIAEKRSVCVKVNAFALLDEIEKSSPQTTFTLVEGSPDGILRVADDIAWTPASEGHQSGAHSATDDTDGSYGEGGPAFMDLSRIVHEVVVHDCDHGPIQPEVLGSRPARRIGGSEVGKRTSHPGSEIDSDTRPAAHLEGDRGCVLLLLHMSAQIAVDFSHRLQAYKACRDIQHLEKSSWSKVQKGMSQKQKDCLVKNLMKIVAGSAPAEAAMELDMGTSSGTKLAHHTQLLASPRDTCCAAQSLLAVAMDFLAANDVFAGKVETSRQSNILLDLQVLTWNMERGSMQQQLHFIKTMASPRQKLAFIIAVLKKGLPKISWARSPGIMDILQFYKDHLLQICRLLEPLLAAGFVTEATKAYLAQISDGGAHKDVNVSGLLRNVCDALKEPEVKGKWDTSAKSALLAAEQLWRAMQEVFAPNGHGKEAMAGRHRD